MSGLSWNIRYTGRNTNWFESGCKEEFLEWCSEVQRGFAGEPGTIIMARFSTLESILSVSWRFEEMEATKGYEKVFGIRLLRFGISKCFVLFWVSTKVSFLSFSSLGTQTWLAILKITPAVTQSPSSSIVLVLLQQDVWKSPREVVSPIYSSISSR